MHRMHWVSQEISSEIVCLVLKHAQRCILQPLSSARIVSAELSRGEEFYRQQFLDEDYTEKDCPGLASYENYLGDLN